MDATYSLNGSYKPTLKRFADLDGPFLTSNNPFKLPALVDGRWVLGEKIGLGLEVL